MVWCESCQALLHAGITALWRRRPPRAAGRWRCAPSYVLLLAGGAAAVSSLPETRPRSTHTGWWGWRSPRAAGRWLCAPDCALLLAGGVDDLCSLPAARPRSSYAAEWCGAHLTRLAGGTYHAWLPSLVLALNSRCCPEEPVGGAPALLRSAVVVVAGTTCCTPAARSRCPCPALRAPPADSVAAVLPSPRHALRTLPSLYERSISAGGFHGSDFLF